MYNPYNWKIEPKETRYEEWNKLFKEIGQLYAKKSCMMLGIQLSAMDLKDSLEYEFKNGELCPNTEHDIDVYMSKIKEYKKISEEIEEKRNALFELYQP